MFPCPDFVRQLIEYFRRFFAPLDHDHPEYENPADWDDRYYTESEVDTLLSGKADDPPVNDDRYYTESEVDTLLSGKADDPHTHPEYENPADWDDRYYTESEVDTFLAGKADDPPVNDGRYYTESEVDTFLAGKSDTGHTHAFTAGKVKQVVSTELSLSFPFYTSGTSEQQIPNFGINVNITTGKIFVLLSLPFYESTIMANTNILSAIDVGGVQRKNVGQDFLSASARRVVSLGGFMWFTGLGTGYKYVSVFVTPIAGNWQTGDSQHRQPRLTVVEFE